MQERERERERERHVHFFVAFVVPESSGIDHVAFFHAGTCGGSGWWVGGGWVAVVGTEWWEVHVVGKRVVVVRRVVANSVVHATAVVKKQESQQHE
jgi:hypothetical protein